MRSHTANSYIIEIRAVALAKMPGWKTLRTLADVCKAAGVAVSCRNLDQLCSAALAQAVQQMQLPGQLSGVKLELLNQRIAKRFSTEVVSSESKRFHVLHCEKEMLLQQACGSMG